MQQPKNYIAINLKVLQNKHGLTQTEIGSIVANDQKIISNWFTGKSYPHILKIQKICNHFNISIDDFVNKKLSFSDAEEIKNAA